MFTRGQRENTFILGGKMMKVISKGNYKPREWKTKVECLGDWWQNKEKACHSLLEVSASDVVKRVDTWFGDDTDFCYGFVCSECHCFTVLREFVVPDEVKRSCPRVAAPNTSEFNHLNEDEKKLSISLLG